MENPNPPPLAVNVSISTLARHTAQQFADEQATLHKARQVFLNTLSVWVVRDYLTLMAVETDFTQGDSWNPLMRHCADVADLAISGLGRLECRPCLEGAVNCYVPPEAWWERMGYIFVCIEPSYTQATLLGFRSRVEQAEVSMGALQSMDDFLAYLYQVRQNPSLLARKYVWLRDWLEGRSPDGWLKMSELSAQMKTFSFRGQSERVSSSSGAELSANAVSRGKFVRLGLHLIPLVIQIEMDGLNRFNLTVRVFPCNGSCLIPEGLSLTVLEAGGNTVLHAQARRQDGILQLRFSGVLGEVFEVRLSLGDRLASSFRAVTHQESAPRVRWVAKTFMI